MSLLAVDVNSLSLASALRRRYFLNPMNALPSYASSLGFTVRVSSRIKLPFVMFSRRCAMQQRAEPAHSGKRAATKGPAPLSNQCQRDLCCGVWARDTLVASGFFCVSESRHCCSRELESGTCALCCAVFLCYLSWRIFNSLGAGRQACVVMAKWKTGRYCSSSRRQKEAPEKTTTRRTGRAQRALLLLLLQLPVPT